MEAAEGGKQLCHDGSPPFFFPKHQWKFPNSLNSFMPKMKEAFKERPHLPPRGDEGDTGQFRSHLSEGFSTFTDAYEAEGKRRRPVNVSVYI